MRLDQQQKNHSEKMRIVNKKMPNRISSVLVRGFFFGLNLVRIRMKIENVYAISLRYEKQ